MDSQEGILQVDKSLMLCKQETSTKEDGRSFQEDLLGGQAKQLSKEQGLRWVAINVSYPLLNRIWR
jgi:hypothetical protein